MIPMVNLRPMLAATEPAWRANLERLFDRLHFILGEQVAAFETELAEAFGAKHAVAVGTGTAAIELGLRAIGLGESGAEVIVPALTSPFTAQAILAAGCRPRFVDVDDETLLLDSDFPITRRTQAVIPVHLYGQPCEIPRGLPVVQDGCQAHGAPIAGRAIAYSFYPTKNLPCLGDGGAVTTDSKTVATRLRSLRDGGRRNDQVARERALNSRLDEMQACYLRAFLPKLPEWNAARIRLAGLYDAALADCPGIRPIVRRPGSVCHLYVVRAARREGLRKFLGEHGIMTGVHYPVPLHLQPAFRDRRLGKGDLPVAELACREIVSLPLWPGMSDGAMDEVAERLREFYRGAGDPARRAGNRAGARASRDGRASA
jgi:dTDP-3-amino-3,4,6-trideoxy-alpha-D-glucose transaminase